MAKEFGVPVQFQRFWLWAKRQNHTYRPNRPLTHQEEAQSVIAFCLLLNFTCNLSAYFFLGAESCHIRGISIYINCGMVLFHKSANVVLLYRSVLAYFIALTVHLSRLFLVHKLWNVAVSIVC